MRSRFAPHIAAAAALFLSLAPVSASAQDRFIQTYLPAKTMAVNTTDLCIGTSICITGTENFDARATGNYASTAGFTSVLAGGAITAQFSGNFMINAANQYGGAGGTGRFITTHHQGVGYSVSLTHTAAMPGINYFGMWLSALDQGNYLEFYNGDQLTYTYTPANLIDSLGGCPSAYCGNPVTNANTKEQYAFVNFYDQVGYFDRIRFHQSPTFSAGYEADNFTFGYRNPNDVTTGTVVGAPAPVLGATPAGGMLAMLLGMVGLRASRRVRSGKEVVARA